MPTRRLRAWALLTALTCSSLALSAPVAIGGVSPVTTLARSDNSFALDLIHQQAKGNLVLSPLSILTALAMVDTGAAGKTARQIQQVLHTSSPARLDRGAATLLSTLEAQPPRNGTPEEDIPQVDIANGLWLQQGFAARPAFLGTLKDSFRAPPQNLDFEGAPEPSREAINEWIAARTAGLIPELMPAGSIGSSTKLMLANAIYLKARWSSEFKPSDTAPAMFTTIGGAQISTTFMGQAADGLPYGQGKGYEAVELPYRDSNLSMLLVMPSGSGFASFQRHLGISALQRIVSSLHLRNVDLKMPRFHLEEALDLNTVLSQLGMPIAFTEAADFSRIGPGPLLISRVQHDADLQVDERGTVAAAATGISVEATALERREHVVDLTLDHPFLFFLRDDRSGAILFAGRFVEPSMSAS